MKVGILTFHRADNTGAVLQAYALQKTLENECDVEAEIIDYRAEGIENTRRCKKSNSWKGLLKNIPLSIYYKIKRNSFDKFRARYLNVSKEIYTKANIVKSNKQYDVFIVGSDQVWNLECSESDYTYFLDFASKAKNSYAASLGRFQFTENTEKIQNLLNEFEHISVREQSAIVQFETMQITNVKRHLDPVFLLSEIQWKQVMGLRKYKGKYIFVYLIQDDVNVINSAQKYAKENDCYVVCNKRNLEYIWNGSPADFLSWIYYAECVFTNSFHGTAFSLIFNVPVVCDIELKNGGVNNRINDLLVELEATECIIEENRYQAYKADVGEKINLQKTESLNYLREVCKG